MHQVKTLDTHPRWKHVATGGIYALMGYGFWKGGVNELGNDNAAVICLRQSDVVSHYEVLPAHYTVSNVHTADAGILQTSKPLHTDDQVAVYFGETGVFARRAEDFLDGRFVKVDDEGQEVAPAKKVKAAPDEAKGE